MTLNSWIASVGQRALCRLHTLHATYWLSRMVLAAEIPGDLVECGVFAGVQCAMMARALMDAGVRDRRVHLFDSFEGIPEAGPRDIDITPMIQAKTGRLISTGVSVCSIGAVRHHMQEWDIDASLLVYHPGWFQDTVPVAAIDPVAILRLDGDLYESTRVCLEHLYPKLSPGGWCIVDDWPLAGVRAAVQDVLGVVLPPVQWQRV